MHQHVGTSRPQSAPPPKNGTSGRIVRAPQDQQQLQQQSGWPRQGKFGAPTQYSKSANQRQRVLLPYVPDALQVPELKVLQAFKPPLPAMAHREEILRAVRQNRVTILSGETGCGKTTQVPQFILDQNDLVPEGFSMIVTQPRRIACITIAERVAQERGESIGQTVGYQIRFVNKTSPSTRLVFCTTAVLLRRLHSDPNFGKISVLCVDEVHERDVYTEFLLMAVRERLARGEMKLKLIIMSATLSVETFVSFFSEVRSSQVGSDPPDADPKSCVCIRGRMFPVKEHFLEDALEWTGCELPGADRASIAAVQRMAARLQERGRLHSDKIARSLAVAKDKDVHVDLMKALTMLFHTTAQRLGDLGKSGILIFLPGWKDICEMYEKLRHQRGLWILTLHSNVSPEDQQRVFADPPSGLRKVVLSTNIAETSVTVDDIVFVINSGVMKERVFDAGRQLGALETSAITWANAVQRKGRVGRTQEGVVVHLFPKWRLAELRKWPTPEILSKSLEEVVLQLLALGLGDPHEVLAKSLSAPSAASIEHAVWLLQEMSMMSDSQNSSASEALLPLGRWLAPIPLHPMSAKALLYGAFFGVLLPVTACVAFLNIKSPFAQPAEGKAVQGGKDILVQHRRSDHYAMATAYLGWRAKVTVGEGDAFAVEHGLSRETLAMGDQLVRSLLRMMVEEYEYDGDDAAFVDDAESGTWSPDSVFEDARTWKLCKAALCAAFVPQFVHCSSKRFVSDSNEEVHSHGSSCNQVYKLLRNTYATDCRVVDDWLVYSDSMKLSKVNIMESTAVSAPYVLLFSKSVSSFPCSISTGSVDFDGWRGTMLGGEEAVQTLHDARQTLSEEVRVLLDNQSAVVLRADLLDSLLQTLDDKRLELTNVCGTQSPRMGEKEAATLFVGNLPENADEEALRGLFGSCARSIEELSIQVERHTGRCRGFAFVIMRNRQEAEFASAHLMGAQLAGRRLRIDLKSMPLASYDGKCTNSNAAKRQWIKTPSEQERKAHVEAMRVRASEHMHRSGIRKVVRSASSGVLQSGVEELRRTNEARCRDDEQRSQRLDQAQQRLSQLRRGKFEHQQHQRQMEYPAVRCEQTRTASIADIANSLPPLQEQTKQSSPRMRASDTHSLVQRWSELLLESARLRLRKRKAVQLEDFVQAGELKRREIEVAEKIESIRQSETIDAAGAEQQQLEEAKKRAVASEDYIEAGRLKRRLHVLEDQRANVAEFAARAWECAITTVRQLSGDQDSDSITQDLLDSAPQRCAPPSEQTPNLEVVALRQRSWLSERAAIGSCAEQDRQGIVLSTLPSCSALGFSTKQLMETSPQDLWQRAWETTWQAAEADGRSNDHDKVYEHAQQLWKGWLLQRGVVGKCTKSSSSIDDATRSDHVQVRGTALDGDKKIKIQQTPGVHGDSSTSKDVGSLIKLRCPADEPLNFETLLAVCPAKTSAHQLIQAMAKDPQEFRQNWNGSEFCVRPMNSRCVDWLPVQTTTPPLGFDVAEGGDDLDPLQIVQPRPLATGRLGTEECSRLGLGLGWSGQARSTQS
mmetsp:Transcript_11266/g.35533  ORF Transcript_11266/g.35533 Transcript_11266/m.35533 type:complete len:1542 (-) Transcript_11266:15-4640(-)